jgi:hypothetical protein
MPDWPAGFVPPFDYLRVPFIFVPDGEPIPQDWLAAHPGWVKFRATFRPKLRQSSPEPWQQAEPDPEQIASAKAPPSPHAARLAHGPLLLPEPRIPPPDLRAGDAQRTFERGALEVVRLYTGDPRYLIRTGMTEYRALNSRYQDFAKTRIIKSNRPAALKISRIQDIIFGHGDRHVSDPDQAQREILDALPPFNQIQGPFWGMTHHYIYRAYPLNDGRLSIGTYYNR